MPGGLTRAVDAAARLLSGKTILPGRLAIVLYAGCATAAAGADYGPISAERLSEHVRVLASDEFEGRAPATEGEAKTVEYLIRHFKALGLEPGGPDGEWTQSFTLARFTRDGPTTVSLRTSQGREPLGHGEQIIVNSTSSDGRISVQDAPLVFVGYAIDAPEFGWNDFKNVDMGKVDPRLGAPLRTTLLTGGAVATLAALFPIGRLAEIANGGTLFAFGFTGLGLLALRVRLPARARPFRLPAAWLIAPVAVLGCTLLFFRLPGPTLVGFAVWMLGGLLFYAAYGRHRSIFAAAPHHSS